VQKAVEQVPHTVVCVVQVWKRGWRCCKAVAVWSTRPCIMYHSCAAVQLTSSAALSSWMLLVWVFEA
jgi:hypothetical protein